MSFSRQWLEALAARFEAGEIAGKDGLNRAKTEIARSMAGGRVPPDSELLEAAGGFDPRLRERLTPFLRTKPMRSLSGVAIVAVMTSPAACPHGRCTFCPGGVEAGSPQAYTGFEPAAMRGARADFDPRLQMEGRLSQLQSLGHPTDKIDLIVMGGTFTAREPAYQESFIKGALDAMNGVPSATLAEAARRNGQAPARCIGLTIETKPDWCRARDVARMLAYGTTRVEIGVQAFDDGVLEATKRGHNVADVVAATREAKDAGLKLCYHLMPGLPGMTPQKDVEGFARMFDDPAFRPDMLKVYPTLVLPKTPIYDEWRAGRYEPYTDEQAAEVVASLKALVPRWTRIQRVDRDIPAPMIAAGPKKSNLRELAQAVLERRGLECICVRCREAGHRANRGKSADLEGDLEPSETTYGAAGGEEVFIEFCDQAGALHAFARLRRAGGDGAGGSKGGDAFLRELRVVGRATPFAPDATSAAEGGRIQHKGLGGRLLGRCEEIAFDEWRAPVVRVTAGVGVRGYYAKLGYRLEEPYMVLPRGERTAAVVSRARV
jgi:elongator complex protein 3